MDNDKTKQNQKKEKQNKENRCQFWLPKKNRFCSSAPFPNSLYCGNHSSRSSPNNNWVPCPLDPSHCVLEDNLEGHLKKCPLFKQTRTLSLQPYYHQGINRGQGGTTPTPIPQSTSEMKRKWVYNLSPSKLSDLLSKITNLHYSVSHLIQDCSNKLPQTCAHWIQTHVDGKIPYQEKHVMQQASIIGNLEDLGILHSANQSLEKEQLDLPSSCCVGTDSPAVVEFGAGKGYLTQILADCYGIKKVFLVERKSYKLKADRSLRKKENLVLERLRIDIEDLNLNAVKSLRGIPYLAIGKHLCGPATDLTLRCCLGEHCDQDDGTKPCARQHLIGIALATCCHHLCQWEHYINKAYLLNMGITKEEFHAITWFTSWAVDADHGSDLSDYNNYAQPPAASHEDDGCERGVERILRNMKPADRAAVGFMCKDIIDVGRFMWVKEHGLVGKLVKYVPATISPENRLLIARP